MPIAQDPSFDSNGRSINPIIEFISGSLVVLKPGILSSSFNNGASMSLAIAASASFALEADPEDNASVQFRVPANSAGVSNDRIAFYVSGSGKIGIGTKDPETPFDVRDNTEDTNPKTGKTRVLKTSRTSQKFDTPITASSNISTEGILFTDDIRRRTNNSSTTRISMGGNNINVFSGDSTNSHIKMLSTVGTVFNEGGLSVYDFRVEGNTDTHLLFVDAGADKVAVGTNTVSDSLLTVDGDIRTTNITASGNISASRIDASGDISASGNIHSSNLIIKDSSKIGTVNGINNQDTYIQVVDTSNKIIVSADGDETVQIQSGVVGIGGVPGATNPLTVYGNISSSGTIITSTLSGGATGDQSGSLVLSGSLTLKPNAAFPAISSSALYATGSDGKGTAPSELRFGGMPIGPYTTVMINCGFSGGTTARVYLPFAEGGLNDIATTSTTSTEFHSIIMPFDGYVDQVLLRSENNCGDVVIGTHIQSDGTEHPSATPGESVTVDMSTDDTTKSFKFSSSTFTAGQIVAISMDSTNASGDSIATLVLKYDLSKTHSNS